MLLITLICGFSAFAILARAETLTVQEKVVKEAWIQGIDYRLALNIAKCESGFINIKNPSASSTATGIFQFVRKTWLSTLARMGFPITISPYDIDTNIKAGVWLIKEDGTSHWDESRSCWQYS